MTELVAASEAQGALEQSRAEAAEGREAGTLQRARAAEEVLAANHEDPLAAQAEAMVA